MIGAANRAKAAEVRPFARAADWTLEMPRVGGGAGSLVRTRLHLISLFNRENRGISQNFAAMDSAFMASSPVKQPIFEKFPWVYNRENLMLNRQISGRNREAGAAAK